MSDHSADRTASSIPAIKFTPDFAVYPPKEQGIYPLRESDWLRLKRLIGRLIPTKRIFEVAASAFFGVTGSAILSLIAFKTTSSLDPWVLPTTWAILFGSLVVAIFLLILDRQQKEMVSVSVESVLEEMQAIEQDYENTRSRPGASAQQSAAADKP